MKATTAWILTDGKAGDEIPCIGLAEALGLRFERRVIAPRKIFALFAPFGPIDPRDRPGRAGSPLRPPFPDIVFAAGRRAAPYMRHVKKASGGRTFTIFLKNPRINLNCADLVWAPTHDGLKGENVISTLIAPHRVTQAALAAARAAPHAQCAALPAPRLAMFVGGPSNSHRFGNADIAALVDSAQNALAGGMSVMITPSRRTPDVLKKTLSELAAQHPDRMFFWSGQGANPYMTMLALADRILVTADSTNMVGEVLATSAPVHVYEPSGGHKRLTFFLDALAQKGQVQFWRGGFSDFSRAPYDETQAIADAVAKYYAAFRRAR